MNTRTFARWMSAALAALMTVTIAGPARADAENPLPEPVEGQEPNGAEAGQAVGDWARMEVRHAGRRPSLALNPTTGDPYLSFYESSLQNFFLGRYTGQYDHSCGGDRGWTCSNVNATPTAGTDTHLAFLDTGAQQFGVVWTIPSGNEYHVSRFDYNLAWAGTDWSVAEGADPAYKRPMDLMYVGGTPILAEESVSNAAEPYKSFRVSRHSADAAPNAWILEGLSGSHSHGRYTSLDWGPGDDGALTANKTERAAYRANTGGLRYSSARYDGTGSGCTYEGFSVPSNWSCSWVDPSADVYATAILAPKCSFQGCTEKTRIFYYDENSGKLRFATATGNANDSCNGAVNWTCGVIDSIAVGKSVDGVRISAAQTGVGQTAGLMKIAYTDKDDGAKSVLKIATYTGNAGDSCTAGGLTGWSCEVVDDGGGTDNTGWEPSLGWNGSRLYIAYYNQTSNTLMVATPRDNAAGIGHTKTYPAIILRGQEFVMKYTVTNGKAFVLTGLALTDALMTYHQYVGVQANGCGMTIEYTDGNLSDVLKLTGGEVSQLSDCTIALRMRFAPNTSPGAYVDGSSTLFTDQTYSIAPSPTAAMSIRAATYIPVVLRDADASW